MAQVTSNSLDVSFLMIKQHDNVEDSIEDVVKVDDQLSWEDMLKEPRAESTDSLNDPDHHKHKSDRHLKFLPRFGSKHKIGDHEEKDETEKHKERHLRFLPRFGSKRETRRPSREELEIGKEDEIEYSMSDTKNNRISWRAESADSSNTERREQSTDSLDHALHHARSDRHVLRIPRLGSKQKFTGQDLEVVENMEALSHIVTDKEKRNNLVNTLITENDDASAKVRFVAAVKEFEDEKTKNERLKKGKKIVSLFVQPDSMFRLHGIPTGLEESLVSSKLNMLSELKVIFLEELATNEVVVSAVKNIDH